MRISTDLGVWVGAICTIGLMSFLYRENALYRGVENAFIGFGAAHALVLGIENIRDLAIIPLIKKGDLTTLIPIALGLMIYARYSQKWSWLSKIPVSFIYGLGAGVAVRGLIIADVLTQISQTIMVPKSVDDLILVVGVVAVLAYFLFSYSHKPTVRPVSRLGRWVLMVAFGAAFANYVTGRSAILIGRLTFLLQDWLGFGAAS